MICLVNLAIWSRNLDHQQNLTAAAGGVWNVGVKENAKDQLDKARNQWGGAKTSWHQEVALSDSEAEEAFLLRAHNEACQLATQSARRHGGRQTWQRETAAAMGQQHPTMGRLELRAVQEDGAKQEKMEVRDRQRQ